MRSLSGDVRVSFDLGGDQPKNFSTKWEELPEGGCRVGHLEVHVPRKGSWDTSGLAVDMPAAVDIEFDEIPEKMVALYLYNPWWTRPIFIDSFTEIPAKTQIMYCRFPDHCACVLPLVGETFKATLTASERRERLRIRLDAGIGGLRDLSEDVYILAEGKTVSEAVGKAFHLLSGRYGVRLRAERPLPEIFTYLGWCSWDAFYKEISEEKVRRKADEMIEKKVPIRWMLLDDGWMRYETEMLEDFVPDKEKFPSGFGQMIRDIRAKSRISWFGVWHAFGGYWAGVDPKSELAKEEREYLYMTRNGRLVPSPEKGAGFYEDWYRLLKQEGIEFVKVDGQGAMPIYFRNDRSFAAGARGMSRELEKSIQIMEGNIINCMGMPMENIVARPGTGLSRNSDDFMPRRENGFAEHLLQNAYNAVYHDQVYYCDWDMFWTQHPDAEKHGLIRAISGGPVYFSDRIGETDPRLAKKFCDANGKLLMLDRSARVSEDGLFTDPQKQGVLKLQNVGTLQNGQRFGVVAAFNLTETTQKTSISAADVPELDPSEAYWLVDVQAKTAEERKGSENKEVALEAGGYRYYLLLPREECVCLGLTDKFVSPLTVKVSDRAEERWIFRVCEAGTTAVITDRKIVSIRVNGEDVTDRVRGAASCYELPLEASDEEMTIEVNLA